MVSTQSEAVMTEASQLARIGVLAAALTTLSILAFDVSAALGAGGVGVGVLPVAFALAIAPCYIVLLGVLHHSQPPAGRFWTGMALAFGIIYAGLVSLNYALQLTVVPQNPEGFAQWTLELKPDSAFWALEVVGYAYMGLSALFRVPVLWPSRLGRIAAMLLVVNAIGTTLGLIGYLQTSDPSNILAVGSLVVWGLTFPAATALLAWQFWQRRAAGPVA
jgi:hypothetical protein